MAFTSEQLRAITAESGNLLLSAAAGSGKTFTLVERILQLLRRGANIDEMLIVTFTRAAAAEMKGRLIERLSTEDQEPHIAEQLRRVEYSSIQTIDAFCSDVLRAHFESAEVDPSFRVPDDAELRQLEQRALEAALSAAYERGADALHALHYGRGVKAVGELALSLVHFAQNRPEPENWMHQALRDPTDGRCQLWFDELMQASHRELWDALALARFALSICMLPEGPVLFAEALQSDLAMIEDALNADYDGLCAMLSAPSFAKLNGKGKKDASAYGLQLREQVQALRDEAKKAIKRVASRLIPRDMALMDLVQNQPALDALLDLALDLNARLTALKAEKSVLSFSDVAHGALRALRNEHVSASMRAHFSHIFVDEYQDVSELQQVLIDCIARPDNVFMVGDVKQSIYRFRQAEPSLFTRTQRDYRDAEGGQLIALTQNFRSRKAVLDFTNAVFERVMVGGESEIEYDQDARLNAGKAFEGNDPPIEFALLNGAGMPISEEAMDADLEAEEHSKVECEGIWIANRIRQLMQSEQTYDGKLNAWRPYRYSDFAVLVRTRAPMNTLEQMLSRAGIPVYADVGSGYLDRLEVKVLLSLLTIIENRRRDLELLNVLRSPIVDLSSAQLAEIRLAGRKEGSYRDALIRYMEMDLPLSHTLREFEQKLDRWRVLSRALPLHELIDTVMRESGYYAHVGTLAQGAHRQANLDLLCTYASDFDATQQGALTGFLRYVRQIEVSQGDMGAAHTLGEGDDVVRLITVHKSKGLEYPVVFTANLGRRIIRSPQKGELYAHRSLGVGLALIDESLGSRRETIAQRAIRERTQLEDRNEEMRILYVLMTRAQDRLILVGTTPNLEKDMARWRICAEAPLIPRSYLDVLAPMLLSMDPHALDAPSMQPIMIDDAPVVVHLLDAQSVQLKDSVAAPSVAQEAIDPALQEQLKRALDWQYPYQSQVRTPMKLTASGVSRELTGPNVMLPITRRPRFMTGDSLTAAERGTITHAALMGLGLDTLRGLSGADLLSEVQRQLDQMLETGRLFEPVAPGLIVNFLTSDIGQRMLRSSRVEREWAFNLRLPIDEVPGVEGEGSLLVQGEIDCCFLEDDQWVLLDYKTDRSDDLEQLKTHYAPQLALYAEALRRITQKPVKQTLLCLLRRGIQLEM
ncbi:helicase-exonuclease AddAB subunit AddA [Eubacteriales bacterium OttesenSCG-928-N13]|nr:helicase-exonuclease AddAB subunit AddA [Eubacteriales bacterium OttesenSCG-928-N13]